MTLRGVLLAALAGYYFQTLIHQPYGPADVWIRKIGQYGARSIQAMIVYSTNVRCEYLRISQCGCLVCTSHTPYLF
jgi:hypothetical protein